MSSSVADILNELSRYNAISRRRLHLIASENVLSRTSRLPFLTDALQRYHFTGQDAAWPGNELLDSIKERLVEDIRDLFGALHVAVESISGLNCMAVALSALTSPGSRLISLAEADGGHGATSKMAAKFCVNWQGLPLSPSGFDVDYERLAGLRGARQPPTVVYIDQFMCLFPVDVRTVREAVGPDVVVHCDASHTLGLIAGGALPCPLDEGADVFGGSTHKTLGGPHKGMLLTNDARYAEAIQDAAGTWVSHQHTGSLVSLALVMAELRGHASEVAVATVKNAQHLGQCLHQAGLAVCGAERGFTRTHQLWLAAPDGMTATEACQRLIRADIVTNAIPIPRLAELGLRLGVQEMTALGMRTEEMDQVALLISRLLVGREDPALVRPAVADLVRRFTPTEVVNVESLLADALRGTNQQGCSNALHGDGLNA